MRVIPTNYVLRPVNHFTFVQMVDLENNRIVACIDPRFRPFNWESKHVHYVHRVAKGESLQRTHNLNVTSAPCMHSHLDQSNS